MIPKKYRPAAAWVVVLAGLAILGRAIVKQEQGQL